MKRGNTNNLFENRYGMRFGDAVGLIKIYFAAHLCNFTLAQEYIEKTGYWGLRYTYNNMMFFISCDRGYLENEITINGQEFLISEFEILTENIELASEKNIQFLLGVIKKLVEHKGI